MTQRDVTELLTCPHCGESGQIEMRGNRRCYGVAMLVIAEKDGSVHLSPDGWNEGEADFDEVWCQACENEVDEALLLTQVGTAAGE